MIALCEWATQHSGISCIVPAAELEEVCPTAVNTRSF